MGLSASQYDPENYALPLNETSVDEDKKGARASAFAKNIDDFLTVSPDWYTSREHLNLEMKHLWTKTWLAAGRESDAAEPGDWFRFEIANESFIIVRGKDRKLRALNNVCTHRGNRLVDQDFGKSPGFICPYHAWGFDLSGKSKRVTDRHTFKEGALCGQLDLAAARCETSMGFVFINMDPAAKPLADYLAGVDVLLGKYKIEDMKVIADIVVEDIGANWKTCLHAFIETYHVHAVHPGAARVSADTAVQIDYFANGHSRGILPHGDCSSRFIESHQLHDFQKHMIKEAGGDPDAFKGTNREVRQHLIELKRLKDKKLQLGYSNFSDSQLSNVWMITIFPNMFVNVHPEGILFMRFRPHGSDPAKHMLDIMILSSTIGEHGSLPFYLNIPDKSAGRPGRSTVPSSSAVVGPVIAEDIRNLQESQKGMASRHLSVLRFSQHEERLQYFFAELQKYIP